MKMKTFLPVMSMVIVVISDNDDDDYEEDFGQSHRQIYIYIYLFIYLFIYTSDGDVTRCPSSLLSLVAAASINMVVDGSYFGCGG